jgi:16S rRNA (guanine527-N7)-methyltransferase
LTEASADALHGLVQLVDWGASNFIPRPDRGDGTRARRAPTQRARIARTVLAESLFGLELEAVRSARRIADIGSGAGFPGLVLAVALPQARVSLIEGGSEKCAFLRRAVAELGVENVEVFEGRARQWSAGMASCDVVTSRKSGHLDVMVEWSAPLVAPGGTIVLWPGTSDFAEHAVAAAADAANAAGLLPEVHPLPSANRHGKHLVKHLYLYRKPRQGSRPGPGSESDLRKLPSPLRSMEDVEERSAPVHEVLEEEIDALARRYELADVAASALKKLVRMADWRQPNFVPKLEPGDSSRSEKRRSRKRPERVALNMFAESLAGLELEEVRAAERLVDIGSGAGFPGLVLAIALPGVRVALIEKRKEACLFLRHATAELGLDNVHVVKARAQQWSDGLWMFDVATSRNAGPAEVAVRLSAPFLAPGGAAVLWQGSRRNPVKEAVAATAADEAGLRLARLHRSEFRHEDGVNVRHLYLYTNATAQPGS